MAARSFEKEIWKRNGEHCANGRARKWCVENTKTPRNAATALGNTAEAIRNPVAEFLLHHAPHCHACAGIDRKHRADRITTHPSNTNQRASQIAPVAFKICSGVKRSVQRRR
jgi:hypothetical protein